MGTKWLKRYTHFVLSDRGVIHSAWENASDARDAARSPDDYGVRDVGARYRVYTRRRMVAMGFVTEGDAK